MKIGDRIKKLRELRNFTQEYMAIQLEMKQAGYSRIERNEVDIPFSRVEQIAKILNISLLDLIGFDENKIFGNAFGSLDTHTNERIQEIKTMYEARIADLQAEIAYLRNLVIQNKSI